VEEMMGEQAGGRGLCLGADKTRHLKNDQKWCRIPPF